MRHEFEIQTFHNDFECEAYCCSAFLIEVHVVQDLNVVLIIGSAPDAVKAKDWDLSGFSSCVAINNAWQITEDWDYLIYPEDLPRERLPPIASLAHRQLVDAHDFVPQQNRFGGFVYAGGTMAFTAGYWALGALKPDVIAFLGCDMVYSAKAGESSHFYGQGSPDPLRSDITLQSLEAKSVRFMALAQLQHCAVVNLSELPDSRLLFPRVSISAFPLQQPRDELLSLYAGGLDAKAVNKALMAEKALDYMVPSGRYWEVIHQFDPLKLCDIDAMWLEAADHSMA